MINIDDLTVSDYSRFMIVSVKNDGFIYRRFCNFKNASLRDTDVDDSLQVSLFGRLKDSKRWILLDDRYDIFPVEYEKIDNVKWIL